MRNVPFSTSFGKTDVSRMNMLDRLQSDCWIDKEGNQYAVEDLGDSHLMALLEMLESKASVFKCQAEIHLMLQPFPKEEEGQIKRREEKDALQKESPAQWLLRQPMYQMLDNEAYERGLRLLKLEADSKRA